jgi:hypothetical protein
MNGPAGDGPQSNAAPHGPGPKLGAMSSTAGTKHNTLPGRLLTTLWSLTVIHPSAPGLSVGTSEAHPP